MAKYGIRANRRKDAPRATIQAAPTVYEITKPAGSAERFLDDAAKEALASAAVAAMPAPNLGRLAPRAVRETAIRYPDPLLAEAARLPEKALAESAARAEAYRRAIEAQNEVVRAASTALSPVGNMAMNQAGAAAHDALTRQDAKGGNAAGPETAVSETPVSEAPDQSHGRTRIVINPQVFKDKRDALCVAMNEGFRILMEANGFDPVSEPTEEQRQFFADTEYARDENMLRRTILARILTFDTSVTDPTESQLQECQEFLDSILEAGLVKTQWEQWAVRRIASLLFKVAPSPSSQPTAPADGPANADAGGGNAEEEKKAAATPTPAADSAPPSDSATPTDVPTPTETPRANDPAPDEAGQAPKDLSKFDETKEEHAQALKDAGHDPAAVMGQAPAPAGQAPSKEAPGQTPNDGKLRGGIDRSQLGQDGRIGGGIDRSQFGQNGRIGIAARIVDPVTGKSRSSLSMNGPAIQPARAIGDMGARALTDTKRMNGPAIQPKRRIGESIKAPEVQEEELMKKRRKGLLG